VVASTSAVFAQNTVITACANNINGALRLVATASDCRIAESPVTWNTTGPQGPAGADGQPGPVGPPGPEGAPGDNSVIAFGVTRPSGFIGQSKTVTVPDLGDVTVSCNTNGFATAGFTPTDAYPYQLRVERSFGNVVIPDFFGATTGCTYTPPLTSAEVVTLRISKAFLGTWKIEFDFLNINDDFPLLACRSAAVITVMR